MITLLATLMSCKGSNGCRPGGDTGGRSTDGSGDDGTPPTPPPPPPPGADDAADGTAGDTPTPPCLNQPIEGESRTRLQCAGTLRATLTLDVTVLGINVDQEPSEIQKVFGNGEPLDEYADPLVMGCCAEVSDPFCESAASQSCYLDFIQTSCQSLPDSIEEKADEQNVFGFEEALDNLAAYIRAHQDECRAAFGAAEVESTAPSCVPSGFSSYSPLLAGRDWAVPGTFSGGATDITNVLIVVNLASVTSASANDPGDPEGCYSIEDNDGAPHFLEIFPSGPLVESS